MQTWQILTSFKLYEISVNRPMFCSVLSRFTFFEHMPTKIIFYVRIHLIWTVIGILKKF